MVFEIVLQNYTGVMLQQYIDTRIIYTKRGSRLYSFYGMVMACDHKDFTVTYMNKPFVGNNLGF